MSANRHCVLRHRVVRATQSKEEGTEQGMDMPANRHCVLRHRAMQSKHIARKKTHSKADTCQRIDTAFSGTEQCRATQSKEKHETKIRSKMRTNRSKAAEKERRTPVKLRARNRRC